MNTSSLSRIACSLAIALGAVALQAHAADLDPITVYAPKQTSVGRNLLLLTPAKVVTTQARIAIDTETLRNESGVVVLNDRINDAALKVCAGSDAATPIDRACVSNAVKGAQPQVEAAIARARSAN